MAEPKDYVQKMRASYPRAREFTRMLYELHQNLGNELAALLDLANVHRLLDVGGGSGVVSFALMRKHPGLTATVIDIENVCIAGREIAAENALADRIEYLPADVDRDDFPGDFGLVMLRDVPFLREDLYRRLWKSLNPGGRLVIVFHFSPAENVAHPRQLVWSFLDSLEDPDFGYPTIAQTQAQLAQAGFHPLPEEHTLPDTRVVIQACK
jgi:SAM-dependent methyltransferase